MTYSIYFNEENVTGEAFAQGYPLERETAYLLYWATSTGWVNGFRYHKPPTKTAINVPTKGLLIGVKEVDTGVFEIFKH